MPDYATRCRNGFFDVLACHSKPPFPSALELGMKLEPKLGSGIPGVFFNYCLDHLLDRIGFLRPISQAAQSVDNGEGM